MEKITFFSFKKENINKRVVLFIIITGLLAIFSYLFFSYETTHFILGIVFFIITIDYYKRHKGKKKEKQIFGILFISLLNFAVFFTLIANSGVSSSMVYNDNGVEYTQYDNRWSAVIFYNDKVPTTEDGNVGGILSIPRRNSIYHRVPRRADDYVGLQYDIEVKTDFRLINNRMTLLVYGQNTLYEQDPDRVKLYEIEFIVSDAYENLGSFKFGGNTTIDGDDNYEYYTFRVFGEIEISQNITNTLTVLSIENSISVPNDAWSYTSDPQYTTQEVITQQFDKWEALIVISVTMLVSFIIIFLFFYFLGNTDKTLTFLLILTGIAVLVLLVMLADSRNTPVIKELIDIIDQPVFMDWDIYGVWHAAKAMLLIIGMVIAFIVWLNIMGTVLLFCWGLWYIWHSVIGKFTDKLFSSLVDIAK